MAYSFEGSRRQPSKSNPDFKELKKNLNLEASNSAFDDELLDILRHFHCNISWYRARIKLDGKQRSWFFAISAILLAIIPIAVFLMTSSDSAGTATRLTAQVTALLTGLIAFHNAVGQWFQSQNGIASFHDASSKLQTELYSFEDEWAPKANDPANAAAFRDAVNDKVRRAREIVDAEKKEYFQRISSLPIIDLGTVLGTAGQAAAGIVSRHRSALSEREIAHANAIEDVKFRQSLVAGYSARIENKRSELANETDAGKQAALAAELASLEILKKQAEDELTIARAELAKYA